MATIATTIVAMMEGGGDCAYDKDKCVCLCVCVFLASGYEVGYCNA